MELCSFENTLAVGSRDNRISPNKPNHIQIRDPIRCRNHSLIPFSQKGLTSVITNLFCAAIHQYLIEQVFELIFCMKFLATASPRSNAPSTAVYLVSPELIASMATSLTCFGVSKSGSPALNPMTSFPCCTNSAASAVIVIVGEGRIR